MSCGGGSFSPIDDTWSRKSSLTMSSWDPYPDLKAPVTCFGTQSFPKVENFCGASCGVGMSNSYKAGNAIQPYGGPSVSQSYPIYTEKFVAYPCCGPVVNYPALDKSWDVQKPYTT